MNLSIIIPSFNQKKLLKVCLNSIFKETKKIIFEVMVVDNASTDGTQKMIKGDFSQVKLVDNKVAAECVPYEPPIRLRRACLFASAIAFLRVVYRRIRPLFT